jgi:hypothetical protein
MGNNITIWTLNRASNLLDPNQDAILEIFKEKGYSNAAFGKRSDFNTGSGDPNEPDINLMPGTEYFVPIAPKCIGGLFDSEPDNVKLKNIRNYYTTEAKQNDYKDFWNTDPDGYRMLTPKYMGYYSILKETAPNFLVGYSQGGLVARYLLWLAEEVFNEPDLVKGVITISSPNFGSPFANCNNADDIFLGFARIVTILLGIPWCLKRKTEKILAQISRDNPENFRKFLKEIGELISSDDKLSTLSVEHRQKAAHLGNLLQELYNWLGGLRNDPNNAFYDLNIFRLDKAYSVLASIFRSNPLTTVRGIISTDNSLTEILEDIWEMILEAIWEKIKKCLHLNKSLPSGVVKLLDREEEVLLKAKSVDSKKRQSKIKKIENVINTQIMVEHETSDNEVIKQRIQNYQKGITSPDIPKYAHDFIIPSAYQLTVNQMEIPPAFNQPNYDANHLSGSDLEFQAGINNVEFVKKLLKEMLTAV